MDLDVLLKKTFDVGDQIFEKERMSKQDIISLLPADFDDNHYKIICDALREIDKIESNLNKTIGGLVFKKIEGKHSKLVAKDKAKVEENLRYLWKEYQERLKRKETLKPEEAVEKAFHGWLKNPDNKGVVDQKGYKIINFVSSARKGREGENVDGYAVGYKAYRYHFLFKPILTSFEVKAELPNKLQGYNKAIGYLRFSHFVYLVFKFEGSEDELNLALKESGYDHHDGVGIYYTRDGETFKCFKVSDPIKQPLSSEVEKHLDRLLSPEEQKILLNHRQQYIKEAIANALLTTY